MLDKIIKMQNNESEKFFYENKNIDEVDKKVDELVQKIYKVDKNLSNEIDEIIGLVEAIYRNECFEIGFKKGLQLANEIRKI